MRGHHPRVMRLYHTTEGTPEGEDRHSFIGQQAGERQSGPSKLPVSSYIVNSCRRRAGLKGAFSAGPPKGHQGCGSAHHDGIDDVTVVVPQCPHGLCPGHIGLGHHQLDVTKFQSSLLYLVEGIGRWLSCLTPILPLLCPQSSVRSL